MAKTQKRRERFTLATSLPLAYRQLRFAKRLSCRFVDSFSWSRRDFCQDGKNTKTPGAFYTRDILAARLPAAALCKTAILPFCGQL
ncbi:hypothetical protein [Rheinheimera sp. F8]|uniref:hypothetical protein n=1 Tax=Rheinheimera sp. F8 TaxID=1763998 RepID=UPI000A4522A3|nr:hypothetical protein [Rheinheimera sp. F8]